MNARVVGLLLAAGRGRRFSAALAAQRADSGHDAGRIAVAGDQPDEAPGAHGTCMSAQDIATHDKLLRIVDGAALARRSCDALAAGCDSVIAVVRPDAPDALAATLREAGARLVVADSARLGMGHSLATAAQAVIDAGGITSVLVLPADMPWVRPDTVRRLADALRESEGGHAHGTDDRIVVPRMPDGRSGHPVGFGPAHLEALARLEGDRGARLLRDRVAARFVEVDDTGILRDVDLPSDLPPS